MSAPGVIAMFARRIKQFLTGTRRVSINGLELQVSSDYRADTYRKLFGGYDRFLEEVVQEFGEGEFVIDIGANTGDTIVSLYSSNPSLRYVGVEADSKYFQLLEDNIKRIDRIDSTRVACIKAFVGRKDCVKRGSLHGQAGTKRFIPGGRQERLIQTTSLDEICEGISASGHKISLVKIDIDGYDFEAIESGMMTIKKHKPWLYFEVDPINTEGLHGYFHTLRKLSKEGYSHFFMFDNYGDLVISDIKVQSAIEMLAHCYISKTTRKSMFYYYDVLVVRSSELAEANRVCDVHVTKTRPADIELREEVA